MDSSDIMDDKDSGPEVQINIPSSVMTRIEELMGGTEQFDSDEFDAVSYINKIFPTEQSLSGVESAAARCEFRLAGVEQDIRRLVRAQAAQRRAGHRALLHAQRTIRDLALQVADINKKAERSESMVREITCEIKQLDCAKSNLTAAITALNHLHMLSGGVDQLYTMTKNRHYKEIALPMQAIMEVMQHFAPYSDIGEVSALRERVREIRDLLAAQILDDFKRAFTAGGKGGVSHRQLAEACGVLDTLPPAVKEQLLAWFIDMQLQEYRHLFSAEQECAWVSHVERRYAWLKRHLLTFEQSAAHVFPPAWGLSQLIAKAFCELTREELSKIMSARRHELDVKLLLYAIQKTDHFELLLHKRFVGTELAPDAPPAPPAPPDKAFEDDAKDSNAEPALTGSNSPWGGVVSACFEPHLSLYINSLDANLRQLVDTFVQDARAAGPEAPAAAALSSGAVMSSCADLFLLYKKCLVQCARLTRGEPMLELAGVFQKYLREYCSEVLEGSLPRRGGGGGGGAGAGGGGVPSLVSNLHTLLNDAHTDTRYTKAEIARITSVISTSEYCLETTVHLEQKLKEKVDPRLAARIDLAPEQDLFHKIISNCIQMLVQDLELSCEPALQAMTKIPWLHLESVGDQSPYVAQLVARLRDAVPALRDHLAASRKYFTQLCIRFANSFIPKFIQSVYRCRPVSTVGAEQLLLDAHMLKSALLALPALGAAVPRPAPATYARVVVRLMTKAEMILKLVLAPLEPREAFAAQAARLLPDLPPAELRRLLDMKPERLSRPQLAALDAAYRDHVRRAAGAGAGAGAGAEPGSGAPAANSDS